MLNKFNEILPPDSLTNNLSIIPKNDIFDVSDTLNINPQQQPLNSAENSIRTMSLINNLTDIEREEDTIANFLLNPDKNLLPNLTNLSLTAKIQLAVTDFLTGCVEAEITLEEIAVLIDANIDISTPSGLAELFDILKILNIDTEAPKITAELANDTGTDKTDKITSDPTIIGTITDQSQIKSLTAGFNNTPTENFLDITAEITKTGKFELDKKLLENILGDTLTSDTYTLKLQAKDKHCLESEILEIEFTLDTEAPKITAELANDTGTDKTDKITYDPTIIGKVKDNNNIESLVVGFDKQNPEFELKTNLDSQGNFELTKELLEEIKGEKLEDGTQTLYFQAIDNSGNNSDIYELYFTLDTTAELTLKLDTEFDTPPKGDNITEEKTVTLSGQTEPLQKVTLEETGETVTANDEGKFEFVEVELARGENTFNATVKDDAGNQKNVSMTVKKVKKK